MLVELGRPNDAVPLLELACERGGTFAEGYYVRAVGDLGAFSQAAQFLARPGAPTLSTAALETLLQRAQTAEAFDAAKKLAILSGLEPVTEGEGL